MQSPARTTCYILALAAVFGGGMLTEKSLHRHGPTQQIDLADAGSTYKFINPLLFCQDQNLSNQGANTMEDTIGAYIDQEKKTGRLLDASFYFRDLNGGPWALVNPEFRSLPSSLLKVPVAISAYEQAEQNPSFLETKVTYAKDTGANDGEYFKADRHLELGKTYTVTELIEYMLEDSDNSALFLLGNLIDSQKLKDSYSHLGIDLPSSNDRGAYTMSVKTYASFFRILYNGTYLSQKDSEQVLSTLSQSSFTQGLVAGIPRSIPVSHKFGEASSPDGTHQLHDCGIVYKPHQPYLICVMTKGADFSTLVNVIAHISETVYHTLGS